MSEASALFAGRRARSPVLALATRADVVAVVAFVVVPAVAFGLPAVLGHPVVPGDDLTQSYPLRVLVGTEVRHGHLPLFDPYIWSGAPLLAGWNAGAAYPFTWLFAVLPGTGAWALNQIVAGVTAGVGTYVFLRASKLRPLPSALGALSFTFAGAMAAQTSHFGLLAGMSWLPWLLLGQLRLSQAATGAARCTWVAVIGAAGAMCVLAGEPRAVDDAVVVVILYGIWRVLRLERGQAGYLLALGAGGILAIGLSAVQWAPGLAAVATSQRAAHSLALFDSGSWPARWLLLLLVPDLLGGSGSLGQPAFFGTYNLTEVTGYVGILPVVAAVALLFRIGDRPARRAGPRRQAWPEWLVWHVVALAGIVLALGGDSPIGGLLFQLPLFGNQRLQSRNILIADFALAMLLAYWVDLLVLARASRNAGRRWWRWAEVVPASAAGVVALAGLAWGAGMFRWLGVSGRALSDIGSLRPWLAPFLVLSILAVALVTVGRRLAPSRLAWVTASFVVADVVVFLVTTVVAIGQSIGPSSVALGPGTTTTAAAVSSTSATVPLSSLGLAGRFAVFDPGLVDIGALSDLGPPDIDILAGTPSVQGYGSIVYGRYAAATGTHAATGFGQDVLSLAAMRNGTLDELDTSALLTPAAYLVSPAGPAARTSVPKRALGAGGEVTWYFGEALRVTAVLVPCSSALSAGTGEGRAAVGFVTTSGATVWRTDGATVACDGDLRLVLPSAESVAGVVIRAGGVPLRLAPPIVTEASGRSVVANGILQGSLVPPRWAYAGHDGPFGVFVDRLADPPLRLLGRPGSELGNARVRALSGPVLAPASASVDTPHGAVLVRSVAAIPGWTAEWRPAAGGNARPLPVRASGVVQAVTVPPGRGVVDWSYEPPGFRLGAALSVASTAVLLAMLAYLVLARRSRRAKQSVAPPDPPGVTP